MRTRGTPCATRPGSAGPKRGLAISVAALAGCIAAPGKGATVAGPTSRLAAYDCP